MRRKKREEWLEVPEEMRPIERHTFCLIGIVPAEIEKIGDMFAQADRDELSRTLLEQAGLPWAKSFEDMWETGEQEARQRGLFDLLWHRRALAIDPVLNAPNFSGFDVLLTVAKQCDPQLADLIAQIDGNNSSNPRRREGPKWWSVWHRATGSPSGGWLDVEEAAAIHERWPKFATAEIEEACLEMQGLPYTHPGCWALMGDFGGFFAQCSSERRAVVGEVGL